MLTQANLYSRWANEICSDDSEERAITVAAMNEIAYIFQIWLPLIVWRQTDAPRYYIGYVTSAVISVFLIIAAFVVRMLHKRELKRKYCSHYLLLNISEGYVRQGLRKLIRSRRPRMSRNDGETATETGIGLQPEELPKEEPPLAEHDHSVITGGKSTSSLSYPESISMENR